MKRDVVALMLPEAGIVYVVIIKVWRTPMGLPNEVHAPLPRQGWRVIELGLGRRLRG